MIKFISKVMYVLQGRKTTLAWLASLFSLISILEVFGIGLVGPFIQVASNPEYVNKIPLIRDIVKKIGVDNQSTIIVGLGLAIIFVFLTKSLLYFLSKSYIQNYSYNQRKLLVLKLLNTYLEVPYTFHLKNNTASYIHNITIETYHFTLKCLIPLLELVANTIVILALMLLLANTSILLLLIVTSVLALLFFIFSVMGEKFKQWGQIVTVSNQALAKTVNHSLGSLKETKIIGCESYFEEEARNYTTQFANAASLFQSYQLLPRIVIETTLIVGFVLTIMISKILFEGNFQEVVPVMSVFLISAIRLLPALSQSFQAVGNMRNFGFALDILYADLNSLERYSEEGHVSASHSVRGNGSILKFDKEIEINNICYKYPGSSSYSIKEISLNIKKGESIALIGKSGAGKTTLVDIILGLLRPTTGDIWVDGTSVYENLRGYQDLIGYIPQSIFLTDETIQQNIAFGVLPSEISLERLNWAIKHSQLEDLIKQLPEGINTKVGERGVRLSGGQRQRIGIARALYHEREILVLDEATSALDSETEGFITDSINALAGNKTLIIISHRLSTIKKCDQVYFLEDGRILKSGTYSEMTVKS